MMKNRTQIIKVAMLLLISMYLLLFSQQALANPHTGQSVNVVIIGGSTLDTSTPCGYTSAAANVMYATWGGCLPVTGSAGELGDFTFTAMNPSAVSAASLALYDTAVLNVATTAMNCNTNTLTTSQKADLVAFVQGGKKLVIYDSECYPGPVNYNWLPFPFTTANPGAMGAQGTLTIVEENTLSSNSSSNPHYIDTAYLSSNTDAVGDMNVMTTYDPNWCVDMSGTNYLNKTGPVHTYAKYPSGTDTGLMIYNGLDQDYQLYGESNLRKMWVQELQQPFNPSGLPCGITVVGITLTPPSAINMVGGTHTVTATLTDLLGNPQPGIKVTFRIIAGPNAGAVGACSPNADCTTDANGQVNSTYSDAGGAGTDQIKACFTNSAGQVICSQVVTKQWTCTDNDGDGYKVEGGICGPVDCNDNNSSVYPGAPDIICDGIDNNCDGTSDDGYVPSNTTCGQGVCALSGQLTCQQGQFIDTCVAGNPTGNDDNCNGVDENCNGQIDENYVPTNTTCGVGACESTGQLVCQSGSTVDTCMPGTPQPEVCNGIDDDCDGVVPSDEADSDGDSYRVCAGDCDDNDPAVNPEMAEVLHNNKDDDCNPATPDNTPPDVSKAYPSIGCLWPPNHKFVNVTIEGVTDPDGDTVTITITKITSDEPTASIDGDGGAKHAPDASGVGTGTASLRAERSGKGNGRVYEITFIASDGYGGETEDSVTVCVPHDASKACSCVNDGQNYDATQIN